jgi:hypothetical protein
MVQSAQGLHWIMLGGAVGWVGESCVVCDAHLFILQFHTGSFGASWQEEIAVLFFLVW